jgi:pimeloyl-ACP methyl ester carboxylesterase
VVFEQGGEASIANWRKVGPAVAAMTRTCFYDRAGFGFSDPPRGPITGLQVTDDLHALIRRAHIRTPIVIVGHSVGGFYATLYTDRFGADVAGLVLVDPGFAGQFHPPTAAERALEEGNIARGYAHLEDCARLARQGALSLEAPQGCFNVAGDLSPDERSYVGAMFVRPAWYEAEESQSRQYVPSGPGDGEDTREERQAARSFGALPVIVLSSANTARDPGVPDAAYADFVARWRAGHDALAARSSRGESYVVPASSHFIQLTQPQAVIDAIGKVVDEVRAAGVSSRR